MDEPTKSFKMLLLPSGKSVRVPHCPGHYVVSNNDWADLTFPLWVMFDDKLKREDELAVAVLDYSRVSPDLQLSSIESLAQPIRVRNNVYKSHKESRITNIGQVKGFRSIDEAAVEEGGVVVPWSTPYGPYKELKIKDWMAVRDFCDTPVKACLPALVKLARAEAAHAAGETGIQDKRMADIELNLKTAHINKLEEKLSRIKFGLLRQAARDENCTI
eukprot:3855110-Pleurochrysis_carterae.AAC.1